MQNFISDLLINEFMPAKMILMKIILSELMNAFSGAVKQNFSEYTTYPVVK